MKNIGEVIQNNLEMKNMTQSELGKKLGLSQKAISKYVTGKSQPSLDTLEKICAVLEININSFFSLGQQLPIQFQNRDEIEILESYRLLSSKNKILIKELLIALQEG